MAELAGLILDAAHHEPHREEVAGLVQALLLAEPELLLADGRDPLIPQTATRVGGSPMRAPQLAMVQSSRARQ